VKQLILCVCLLNLSGCTWDDWVAADEWLSRHGKVRARFDGPFSHKALYENSIEHPYMTPLD
jgi:hypothetical protein